MFALSIIQNALKNGGERYVHMIKVIIWERLRGFYIQILSSMNEYFNDYFLLVQ